MKTTKRTLIAVLLALLVLPAASALAADAPTAAGATSSAGNVGSSYGFPPGRATMALGISGPGHRPAAPRGEAILTLPGTESLKTPALAACAVVSYLVES